MILLYAAMLDKHFEFFLSDMVLLLASVKILLDRQVLLVCLSQAKNVYRAHTCVVAKLTNIVLDKQNIKCVSNACQTKLFVWRELCCSPEFFFCCPKVTLLHVNRAQSFRGHGSLAHDYCYCLQKKITANKSRRHYKLLNVFKIYSM